MGNLPQYKYSDKIPKIDLFDKLINFNTLQLDSSLASHSMILLNVQILKTFHYMETRCIAFLSNCKNMKFAINSLKRVNQAYLKTLSGGLIGLQRR